jgi:hypothetical protein
LGEGQGSDVVPNDLLADFGWVQAALLSQADQMAVRFIGEMKVALALERAVAGASGG